MMRKHRIEYKGSRQGELNESIPVEARTDEQMFKISWILDEIESCRNCIYDFDKGEYINSQMITVVRRLKSDKRQCIEERHQSEKRVLGRIKSIGTIRDGGFPEEFEIEWKDEERCVCV
jgi:hypothetical protein